MRRPQKIEVLERRWIQAMIDAPARWATRCYQIGNFLMRLSEQVRTIAREVRRRRAGEE